MFRFFWLLSYAFPCEGLPLKQIGTNAQASKGLSGRTWRVTFEIEVLASEEAAVRQKLLELKNSEDFANSLKEAWSQLFLPISDYLSPSLPLKGLEARAHIQRELKALTDLTSAVHC